MDPEKIHEVATEMFPSLGPKEAAAEMNIPAFTFTAVRHPFTRLNEAMFKRTFFFCDYFPVFIFPCMSTFNVNISQKYFSC